MNVSILKITFLFFIGPILLPHSLYGQICDNKYSSIQYKGSSYDTFTRTIYSKNEIVSAGRVYDYNDAGHIAKFSSNGTPLWSYLYTIDYFSFYPPTFFKTIYFTDIIAVADGGYLVSGNFDRVLSPFGSPPPVKKFALLAKLDKFGKVLWSKTLSNEGNLSLSNVYETSDGDYIAYLATDNGKKQLPGDHSYSKILRIGVSGNIKWSKILFTYLFDAGGLGLNFKRAITQTSNKNIILGHVVHKAMLSGEIYRTVQGNLHFLEFNYETGNINWETSYEYPVPLSDTLYTPDIVSVNEMPDGRLSFIASLYLSTNNQPALTKKGANIITNNKGKIETLIAYYPNDGSPCKINEVTIDKINNTKTLLLNKENNAVLTSIANNGQVNWSRGYSNDGGQFPVNCFSAGKKGYNIFMSNFSSFNTRLLITDSAGKIDCVNLPVNIIAERAAFDFPHDSVTTNTNIFLDTYLDWEYPFKRKEEYPLVKNIECQQTVSCCTDFIDSTNFNNINICEGKSFTLPDGTIVKDSGSYYVTFKTALGCDSIRYYHIYTDKDVAKLNLGKDTCLTQSSSIKLLATPGYNKYYWQNNLTPDSNTYTVNAAGLFKVSVANTCGSKTDSIHIYEQCDYTIYMPSAFTPNNDNQNDYYGIPKLNKNRLLSFKIFNRWGQLVFQTTDPKIGWNGRFRGEPLQFGTFIYYLEMEGLSGNRMSAKGTFMLIR
jgi:gliding motility-associated-like protein